MRLPKLERGQWIILGVVGVFALHRILVMLSAGDFLYPLEPSEAKNSQIAWDLMTGRFGTEDYGTRNYIANSGSIHHGSYSTMAISYWFVSRFAGYGLVSIRLVPLLFTTAAMLVWLEILRRTCGLLAAVCGGVALTLVPTLIFAFQLTFLGCHPESVFPLALTIGAWLAWLHGGGSDGRAAALFGACVGYSLIFSYLLWPFVALMVALSFVPPLPRPRRAAILGGLGGFVVGLWPFWLMLLFGGPDALFGSPITEREETTLANVASGAGMNGDLFWQTVQANLPAAFHDFWMGQRTAPGFFGGSSFEVISYRLLVLAPLGLLPWAVTDKDPRRRRLLLLVGLAPTLVYGWLAFASPWKPHIPVRYFMPFALLGFSAPAIMVGVGVSRFRNGAGLKRWLSVVLAVAGAGVIAWQAPMRVIEAAAAVKTERMGPLLRHRYVTYYNLGVGTIWAEQVDQVNDMIDVRTAEGDPDGFDGFQAALWGSGRRLALGEGDWTAPELGWDSLRSGLNEWSERQEYLSGSGVDDAAKVAHNVGWGAGIRAEWNAETVARVEHDAKDQGGWPGQLQWSMFWEGFGFGLGRAVPDIPANVDSLPDAIPDEHREAVVRGMEAGRATGQVPKAPRKPIFPSVRGPAT